MSDNRKNWYLRVDSRRHVVTTDVESGFIRFHLTIWVDGQQIHKKSAANYHSLSGIYPIPIPSIDHLVELHVGGKMLSGMGKAGLKHSLKVNGQEVTEGIELNLSEESDAQSATQSSSNDDAIAVLKKRLALGEIDADEYNRLLKIIDA